jgi:AcrR family transcriptional regulator
MDMTTPTRPRNPRGQGDLLRGEILRAAIMLVEETGDAASLTLRGIARRAGISAPSIYTQFADLPTLINALLEVSFDELAATVGAAIESRARADERLIDASRAYVRFGWEHSARYRLMFAADGYAANAVDTFALFTVLLQDCIDAGLSGSADPRADTWMVWAACHGVATLAKPARSDYLRLGALDRPAMLDAMVERLAGLDSGR